MAYASPAILATSATPNNTVGPNRLNPSDFPSAVAHTASKTPDTTNTIHDMTTSGGRLVAHRVRLPRPGPQPGTAYTMANAQRPG